MEYNRCQIPKISIKIGEREINERKKDLENENRQEQLRRRDTHLQTPGKRHCEADIRKYFTESTNLQNKKPPKENNYESVSQDNYNEDSTNLQPPIPPHTFHPAADTQTRLNMSAYMPVGEEEGGETQA